MYRECTAPGGGADPDWKKNKDEYDARKAKAEKDLKGKGSGKDGKNNGKGKGDDKGKAKGTGKNATGHWEQKNEGARAAVDQELARAAAIGGAKAHFPRQGIGLDSWANVHLIHQRPDTVRTLTLCHSLTEAQNVTVLQAGREYLLLWCLGLKMETTLIFFLRAFSWKEVVKSRREKING